MEVRKALQQTEVGIAPTDWILKSIDEMVVPGGLIRGPFGGALKKEIFVRTGFKVYEQKNAIYRDAAIGNYFIDDSTFSALKRFEVNPGDFIVSCSGTIGRIFHIPSNAARRF